MARQEELENNPMKLLEERTAASKHEMDLAESLEELKELNRRKKEVKNIRGRAGTDSSCPRLTMTTW